MTTSAPDPRIEELSPAEVVRLLNDDLIVLVDVREPHEFAQARIPGATLRPLSNFDARTLPPDEPRRVVFQCGSGVRSRSAAAERLRAGAARAAHLTGGIRAWREAGFEVICEPGETPAPHK